MRGYRIGHCSFSLTHRLIGVLAALLMPILAEAQMPGTRIDFSVSNLKGGTDNVWGYLQRPAAPKPKNPAVVLIHGTGGLLPAFSNHYIKLLTDEGYIVLAVDSYSPRGITNTAADQGQILSEQMTLDALGALKALAQMPDVDAEKIAALGHSKGGTAVWQAAHTNFAPNEGPRFAAVIAIYPACTLRYREPKPVTPILVLLGDKDFRIGYKGCVEMALASKQAGGNVETILYEGAPHDFDGPDNRTGMNRNDFAENYADCIVWLEPDGSITAYGKRFPDPYGPDVRAEMRRSCVTKGVYGYTHLPSKAQAAKDITQFLSKTIGKPGGG